MLKRRWTLSRVYEAVVEGVIKMSGITSIIIVCSIFLFLLKEGLSLFSVANPIEFLFGEKWHPVSEPPSFGILSLIAGSIFVTLGAGAIAIPLGIGCAVYIAEIAPKSIRELLKVTIEFLAAIPSVVIGFIGMVLLAPFIQKVFSLPTGLCAATGSIMLALMAMPTIVSIAEDAITAVPKQYREAALALGATKWQMIHRVIIKAAAPGILAASMLGIGRVIGETMAVMMITGNSARIPASIFDPIRTLTATIAAEMGETVQGSDHYFALFAIGIVLFIITFFVNIIADVFLHREIRSVLRS
jgi:phosphate transport system permease protein